MTTQELTKACAELDGFHPQEPDQYGRIYSEHLTKDGVYYPPEHLPNYLHSYDAMISVIVKWCGDDHKKWGCFYNHFCSATGRIVPIQNEVGLLVCLLNSTPTQLATALVKAAGVWKE